MVATIQVNALRVRRSNKTILDIPQLVIDERPTLLLGANGAGKSTLFSALASDSSPKEGTVLREGSISIVEQKFNPITGFTSSEYLSLIHI